MFPHSAATRLLSAGLLDKQQIEEGERLRRLGETQRRGASALLSPGLASPAADPLTEGFFGTSLFGRLVSRRQSRRDSEASGAAEAGGRSRRGSWAANTELVSVLDREQLATPRDTRCRPAPPRTAVMCDVCRKRSYSLVSLLDTTQTRESCSAPHHARAPPRRDLAELTSLQEALPVARAAARFRSKLEQAEAEQEARTRHRGRLRRKSHSLY